MNDAKIRFSQSEMELILNANLILTKNNLLKKIDHFLSGVQVKQKELLDKLDVQLPPVVLQSSPKISKGENYMGLPYRMLDYPKFFNQSDVFAIRTMFWWGHFFSVTAHLSGTYKSATENKIITAFERFKKNGWYCCVNNDQWEHHFEASNYTRIDTMSKAEFENIVSENSFCKLAIRIPIQQLDIAEGEIITSFKKIIEILAN